MRIMRIKPIAFSDGKVNSLRRGLRSGDLLLYTILEPKLGTAKELLKTARGAYRAGKKPLSAFAAAEQLEASAKELVEAAEWDSEQALRAGELKTPGFVRETAAAFLVLCDAASISENALAELTSEVDCRKGIPELDYERQLVRCAGDIKAGIVNNGFPEPQTMAGFMEALRYFL